jgi:hypothetical protein
MLLYGNGFKDLIPNMLALQKSVAFLIDDETMIVQIGVGEAWL